MKYPNLEIMVKFIYLFIYFSKSCRASTLSLNLDHSSVWASTLQSVDARSFQLESQELVVTKVKEICAIVKNGSCKQPREL